MPLLLVTLFLWLPLPDGAARSAAAGEETDVERLLFDAGRLDLSLAERLAAASKVLGSEAPVSPEGCVRASLGLLAEARLPAAWLLLRAVDGGWLPQAARDRARDALAAAQAGTPDPEPVLAGAAWLLGVRSPEAASAMTASWPPTGFVRSVLEHELGYIVPAPLDTLTASGVQELLVGSIAAADLLDAATSDQAVQVHAALDGLLALGPAALPTLQQEARVGARGEPAGRMPRACRALLALGMMKKRAATADVVACLDSSDGWVRVSAAQALGDLGDPAGAVPLAVLLATLGDPHRPRDSWEYPGTSGTTVAEADWPTVDYYCIDCAAADALMRLGVPRAAGYVIQEKLDPSRGNFRIRVYQDAVDALRRSLPSAADLVKAYNVDTGLPLRDAAFMQLAEWWHAHRDADDLLGTRLDENDPGFRRAASALVARLTGTDIRQFMITKPACALLGRAVTPTLLETLATATRGAAMAELAKTLGLVRDPRAVPALVGLLQDKRPFVRAAAAEGLGAYASDPVVQRALIALLGDTKEGPRVSAMAGLLGAPPSDQVLAAVRAAAARAKAAGATSPTSEMPLQVLLLVQEGDAHWPAVQAGLNAQHRYERESWWALVQRALDLPDYVHDAAAAADSPLARRLPLERVQRAREARMGR